jgi:glutathione synthase
MNFLIIGDPIAKLKSQTDTSLALVREALTREHEVHWAEIEDVVFWNGRAQVRTQKLTACAPDSLPRSEQGHNEPVEINTFDGVWIRKDPPFDQNYMSLCWLLALEEENVPMLNRPSLLLRYHEKMLPFEAVERGHLTSSEVIPTFLPLGARFKIPSDFPKGEAVNKPWLGHGGKDVTRLEKAQSVPAQTILQPLQKSVERHGDRRIFVLDGAVIGSFVRIPPTGSIISNIASGGTGLLKEMNPREKALAEKTAAFLKEIGIIFAGLDMIDEQISEINITSPTGFRTLANLNGPRLEKVYLDYAESLF